VFAPDGESSTSVRVVRAPWLDPAAGTGRWLTGLSDNSSAYRSHAWRQACTELCVTPKHTRPLPTSDQRQDRTHPPHPGRRLGLRPHVGRSRQRGHAHRWRRLGAP
jgi:transposase InsO family protein